MNEQQSPKASKEAVKQVSSIWLVPLVAIGIGIWMFYQFITSQGPEITLTMDTAEGIEVGKTEIRALNVKVGVVKNVTLNDDYSAIQVVVQMDKNAARMLKDDTLFWVVKPRIGKEGVSGLETLLSGAYIQLRPGRNGKEQRDFTVLEIPPVAPPDAKGIRIILTHNEAGKLGVGDPVLYEGFTVGRVEKATFDPDTKKAHYQLFIFEPYNGLIRKRSRFWLTSGIDLNMSAEGFNLKIGSIESLITGGVSFRVPKERDPGALITAELSKFRLYNNLKQVKERFFDEYLEYVMFFDESVRGLNEGAPIEYRGIRVGTVQKVPLSLSTMDKGFTNKQIPVLVRIELGRVLQHINYGSLDELKLNLEKEFHSGLRASLKTGNILTGALLIDLEQYPDEKRPDTRQYSGYDLFPTKAGGFAQIQKQIMAILNKVNELPVEDTLKSLNATLSTSQKSLAAAEGVAKELTGLLAQKDTQAIPGEIRLSLEQIQQTLNGFGPDAQPYQNLEQALAQFEHVMAELQPVLRQLNEKPNSLIFSSEKTPDPIPAGGVQ
ncbi:intermembrane transport protein PqiB [Photobacterium minamisatsumaniensis]|uniref:intermembrane transport protein PqiB n=1 Tax=Photobacterium minamisatsumaniensis TaxID=2910233 RepID=UPI003D12A6CC